MRVLLLIDHLGSGGAQTLVVELAAALQARGVDIEIAHLFGPNLLADALAEHALPCHDLSTGGSYSPLRALDPRPVRRLRKLVSRGRYDVVHLHLYIAPLHLLAAFPFAGRRMPVVNTVHAHKEELPGYIFPSYRLTRRRTSHYVTDFPSLLEDLSRIGVPPDRMTHIPFGIEPVDMDVSARERVRGELELEPDDTALVSVARLHPQRFLDRFIRAMPGVVERVPGARLVLVGDGSQESELRALTARLGLREHIRFAGRRGDLGALYAAADGVLTVSRRGDVGIAALQAVSAGVPCISWDNGGFDALAEGSEGNSVCDVVSTDSAFVERVEFLANGGDALAELARCRADLVRTEWALATMVTRHQRIYAGVTAPEPG